VDECLELVESGRAARSRMPVCSSCANWTRELDTFWSIFVYAPMPHRGSKAAADGPLPWRWLGSLSLVNLASTGRRYHCDDCSPSASGSSPAVPAIANVASLNLVVGQLSDGKSRYVSYRDSPTTELLQDALGGRNRTAWLTHVIPGGDSMNYDETRAGLLFAQRVGKIRNRPQRIGQDGLQQPAGLAPDAEKAKETDADKAVAEEKELEELKKMLIGGRESKRPSPARPAAR
jgi:hypothetical protein